MLRKKQGVQAFDRALFIFRIDLKRSPDISLFQEKNTGETQNAYAENGQPGQNKKYPSAGRHRITFPRMICFAQGNAFSSPL